MCHSIIQLWQRQLNWIGTLTVQSNATVTQTSPQKVSALRRHDEPEVSFTEATATDYVHECALTFYVSCNRNIMEHDVSWQKCYTLSRKKSMFFFSLFPLGSTLCLTICCASAAASKWSFAFQTTYKSKLSTQLHSANSRHVSVWQMHGRLCLQYTQSPHYAGALYLTHRSKRWEAKLFTASKNDN